MKEKTQWQNSRAIGGSVQRLVRLCDNIWYNVSRAIKVLSGKGTVLVLPLANPYPLSLGQHEILEGVFEGHSLLRNIFQSYLCLDVSKKLRLKPLALETHISLQLVLALCHLRKKVSGIFSW